MRKLILFLLGVLLTPALTSASNVTVSFHAPPGYILNDATVRYNASCSGWLVGVFNDGTSLQSFALYINRRGKFSLTDYIFPGGRNPKLYLNSSCPINVSISPEYQPDMFPNTVKGEYRRYLLTKVGLENLGNGTFRINVPWKLVAIYLKSNTIHENGTYVPKLPLNVEVSWDGKEINKTPAPAEPPTLYWVDLGDEKPSGEVLVKISGERAKFITGIYGYILIPYQSYYPAMDGFPFISPRQEGCQMEISSYYENVKVEGEFLWRGNDFTLLKFITSHGETKELYVKGGHVCYGKWPRRTCGKASLPKGALKLMVGFNGRYLWVWSDGGDYFETKLNSLGITPVEFLDGIPEGDIYGVNVYAANSVPEEEDNPWDEASLALSIIAVVISLTALVMSRKKS